MLNGCGRFNRAFGTFDSCTLHIVCQSFPDSTMNQTQCNALRDYLFAAKFQSGSKEGVFRYLAVLPGGAASAAATVHYAYAPPTWDRAGEMSDAASFLMNLIAKSPYARECFQLQHHDYLRNGWLLPWGLTAKASQNDFPTLVLLELANGAVTGALMRNSQLGRAPEKLADAFAEPEEAARIIRSLRELEYHDKHLSWYKDSNIDATTLDEALASTPETDARQKEVLVYRDTEWLWGLWNSPKMDHFSQGLHLSSVADFHGTRVSAAKRTTRSGLDEVRKNQTIQGDCAVLEAALGLLQPYDMKTYASGYEATPAVKALCAWWNQHAPEEMRHAGLFRTYVWSEEDRIFSPGDPEEPALQGSILADEGVYALFEQTGRPPVAIQFHRGRAFNKDTNGGTQTYMANGNEGMDIGMGLAEVDEAYYAVKGLQSVKREW
jgi:hypothetical protein